MDSKGIFSDTLDDLKARINICDLCRLLGTHVKAQSGIVKFFRVGSSLTFQDLRSVPIVSLYTSTREGTLGKYPNIAKHAYCCSLLSQDLLGLVSGLHTQSGFNFNNVDCLTVN